MSVSANENTELQAALRSIGSTPFFSSDDLGDDSGNSFSENLRNEYIKSPECAEFFSWFCRERGMNGKMPSDEESARRNREMLRRFIDRKLREFGCAEDGEGANPLI